MTRITTHVLDTAAGLPAPGIPVTIEARAAETDAWTAVAATTTDDDGRTPPVEADADTVHRLHYDLAARGGFFPEVTICFSTGGEDHLHVPLLLSPFGYTTYRGS